MLHKQMKNLINILQRATYSIPLFSSTSYYSFFTLYLLDSQEFTDLILLVTYYLNFEIILVILIFVVLFNKNFFRRHGLFEVVVVLNTAVLLSLLWLIAVMYNVNISSSSVLYFPWHDFFSNQYFYFFATTEVQLRLLFVFYVFVFCILTIWTLYYLDEAHRANINFELFSLFLANLIFCSLLLKVNNLFAVWCMVECISIIAYILTAFNSQSSLNYSFIYFIFNSIAGAIMLWGISLLTTVCHTDFFLSPYFTIGVEIVEDSFVSFSFTLILLGFFIKLGLVPFHMWAVEVYKHISTELLFTFLIINKSAFIFTVYRIILALQGDFAVVFNTLNVVLIPMILLTIVFGAIFAFSETNFQAFLALSSLPQTGYVLLGLLNSDFETRTTALVYFIIYITTLLVLYYALFFLRNSINYISDLTGLFYSDRLIAWFLLFVMGSFSGIPPFGTFLAKFYLFNNLAVTHSVWVVLFVLIVSVISIVYYIRVAIVILTAPTKPYFIIAANESDAVKYVSFLSRVGFSPSHVTYYFLKVAFIMCSLISFVIIVNVYYNNLLFYFYP